MGWSHDQAQLQAFGKCRPKALPWYFNCWWISVSMYQKMFCLTSFLLSHTISCFLPFFQQNSVPFLCSLPTPLHALLIFSSLLFVPYHPPCTPPCTDTGRKSCLPSAAGKMENEDELSLIICSLRLVSISEQSGTKEKQGEIAYLHLWVLNLTAEPLWYF